MLQSNPNALQSSSRINNQNLNIDIGLFLDLITDAAVIINDKGKILVSNSRFAEIINSDKLDIENKQINDFIKIAPDEDFFAENGKIKRLNRTGNESISVQVNHLPLDKSGNIHLVTICPESRINEIDPVERKLLIDLEKLIALFDETEIHAIYEKVINIASDLLETNSICIYQAESGFPKLTKVSAKAEENVFPGSVSITELIRLTGITIWTPEKKVFSEIHRAGRISNFAYVASISLGDESAKIGLLVVGDQEKLPVAKIHSVLSVLGTFISTVLQHRFLISNLREEKSTDKDSIFLYNQLTDASSEGIMIVSPSMTLSMVNPAAEMMLGYSDWEILDKEIENILIGPEGLWQALQDALNGIPTHDLGNVSLHRRNGQSFPALVQIIPVVLEKELKNIIIFIRDISEHEQNRIRTQQLEHRALLGVFTAIFAHEVRNPINNISTGLQLLSTNLHPTDPNQDLVNRIQADCGRLTN